MKKQCVYPTVRFVAYEQRGPSKLIFVPDPSMRGRYVLTDRCVALVACPTCKSIPGEPCKTNDGYRAYTHFNRRGIAKRQYLADAHDIIRKPHIKLAIRKSEKS